MENLAIYIIVGILLLVLIKIVSISVRKSNVKIPNYSDEIDILLKKKWTKDEFMTIAFYVLYEKKGKNDEELINSIAIATKRSYASVYKKVIIFSNLENTNNNLHKLEREVYNEFKRIGKHEADKKVCKAIENIIELNNL